jgi:hypothetical protein
VSYREYYIEDFTEKPIFLYPLYPAGRKEHTR